jgi:hypothetical protein
VSGADMFQFVKQKSQTQHVHIFMYSKLLEATLPGVCHEVNPNSLIRSPLKMGVALKNKFLVIKIVSGNMLFIF